MSGEVVKECGEEVGKFMADLTVIYMSTFVNKKLEGIYDGALNKMIPPEVGEDGDEEEEDKEEEEEGDGGDGNEAEKEENDDNKEEKKEEAADPGSDVANKKQVPPIAAGAHAIRYKMGVGVDNVEHFYMDLAVFNIKPKDSVIKKKVLRHSVCEKLKKDLESKYKQKANIKNLNMGGVAWPKKKMFGKNAGLYKARFTGIRTWLKAVSDVQELSTSNEFLSFFGLVYDENEAFMDEVFEETIEDVCDKNELNYDKMVVRASKLGLDLEKGEMLKFLAIEKIARKHITTLKGLIDGQKMLPGKLKLKAKKKAENTIAKVIGGGVEAGWKGVEPVFEKVSKGMNAAIDKAREPLEKILGKALNPIGDIMTKTFDKSNAKFSVKIKVRTLTYERFGNLTSLINSISEGGDCVKAGESLLTSVSKMKECEIYASYFTINLKVHDAIKKFIPFIEELEENATRLAIGITDCTYILGRAGVRAFQPLLDTLEKQSKEFKDEASFKSAIQAAVREGGKKLALDYFGLGKSLKKTMKGVPKSSSRQILRLAKVSVIKIADLLGSVASKLKPTSKDDIKSNFIKVLKPLLNRFLNLRINHMIRLLRAATQKMISGKLMSLIKPKIKPILDIIDELCKALPPPFGGEGGFLKPGKIIMYLISKAVANLTTLAVNKLSEDVLKNVYEKDSNPNPLEKSTVRSLRSEPEVREKDFDEDPEEDDEKDADEADEAGGDEAGGDAAGDEAGGDE